MKKKLCALLASALALSLVLTGCGGKQGFAGSSRNYLRPQG